MSITRLDHILIKVSDLDSAVIDFRNMGFKVYYGSTPESKAYNAMIYFKDESFIELVDTSRFPKLFYYLLKWGILKPFGIMLRRVTSYVKSENGLIDYCVYSNNIEADYNDLRTHGRVSKLSTFKRINHLGQELKWKLFSTNELLAPFVISDYKPHKLPEPNADCHDNYAIGIYAIDIAIPERFEEHINLFSLLYLSSGLTHDKTITFNLKNSRINCFSSHEKGIGKILIKVQPEANIVTHLWNLYHLSPNYTRLENEQSSDSMKAMT